MGTKHVRSLCTASSGSSRFAGHVFSLLRGLQDTCSTGLIISFFQRKPRRRSCTRISSTLLAMKPIKVFLTWQKEIEPADFFQSHVRLIQPQTRLLRRDIVLDYNFGCIVSVRNTVRVPFGHCWETPRNGFSGSLPERARGHLWNNNNTPPCAHGPCDKNNILHGASLLSWMKASLLSSWRCWP